MNPLKRMTYWRYSGDSRMKKWGALRGQGRKQGAKISVSPAW